MRYEIGSRVIIKSDAKRYNANQMYFDGAMCQYRGRECTIIGHERPYNRENVYYIDIDNGRWCWVESWLTPLYAFCEITS